MITPQLQQELLAADSAKQAIELILENCWSDWQQDEAMEFVEENTTLFNK